MFSKCPVSFKILFKNKKKKTNKLLQIILNSGYKDVLMQSVVNPQNISFGNLHIEPKKFYVIAGPCSIESPEQFRETAAFVKEHGASILRGGIYKMRTKPNSFQGVGAEALQWIAEIKKEMAMPLISEVTDPRQIPALNDYLDGYQVGSRNMYNYELLKDLGTYNKPVLLKRGFSALLDEWLNAAQYVLNGGNTSVLLCERGIRTFETKMRNTLDLASVAYLKQHCNLPVIVDPSHGTGDRNLVAPMACAAVAAGADGIMVEVHPDPAEALSDGFQALNFENFKNLMSQLKPFVEAAGKTLVSYV
ncbi:MAG: 3-deoxy-7-phosphoheptulonate synthase [Bdellovibrionaceae bacterium]|nr:3-deoxy-7-phosphoheptulonate synthase [Pseudobdellovibrionaceae bacterium]